METPRSSLKWLKPSVEYGPILVFFAAYYLGDLFAATTAIMVATAIALGVSYVLERRIPMMPLITAVIIGIFGGLTLWLQDETFIKMKPTIIQTLFGLILMGGLMMGKLFLKSVMGSVWQMHDAAWRSLTVRFAGYFFAMAIINELVWRTQSTDFWVNFKVFGIMGLTFFFIMSQMKFIQANVIEGKKTGEAD
ncbi:MAG: septation protein A [Rhodospirillales bacterium]|nr:septation protein A [Rhodospirillales bacterium]